MRPNERRSNFNNKNYKRTMDMCNSCNDVIFTNDIRLHRCDSITKSPRTPTQKPLVQSPLYQTQRPMPSHNVIVSEMNFFDCVYANWERAMFPRPKTGYLCNFRGSDFIRKSPKTTPVFEEKPKVVEKEKKPLYEDKSPEPEISKSQNDDFTFNPYHNFF